MKLVIEKVPQGVRVQLITDTSKKPVELILQASQVPIIDQMLRTALNADKFRFEMEM